MHELSRKAWFGTDLAEQDVTFTFSTAAAREIRAHLESVDRLAPGVLDLAEPQLPQTRHEAEALRRLVEEVRGFAIVEPLPGLDGVSERRAVAWLIGSLVGAPVEQSAEGVKVVHVYDRDRSRRMQDGARYHQTRHGGSIHTDNVNRPETWDYLLMTCLFQAMVGGESIVVSGVTVYHLLRERAPRALEILARDFWWECRGFSEDCFRAPVLWFDFRGEPQFRYLRDYLEGAHLKKGKPLSDDQLWALDTLDSALELSDLQFRHDLAPGQTLVIDDKQMFHGRTSFSDLRDAVPYDAAPHQGGGPFRRCLDRLWIRKHAA